MDDISFSISNLDLSSSNWIIAIVSKGKLYINKIKKNFEHTLSDDYKEITIEGKCIKSAKTVDTMCYFITDDGCLYSWNSIEGVEQIHNHLKFKTVNASDHEYILKSYDDRIFVSKCVYNWIYYRFECRLTDVPFFDHIKILSIACGAEHSIFLSYDCKCFGFGSNTYGQLGIEKNHCNVSINDPIIIKFPNQIDEKIIKIACGSDHSIYLNQAHMCFGSGRNDRGQLGNI